MRKLFGGLAFLAVLSSTAWCDLGGAGIGSYFQQGNKRLSLNAGYGALEFNDETRSYFIIGAGAGYYILNGLEAGIDGQAWLGSKPHLYSASPEIRYTFYQLEQFKPYVGAFYRRTFYDSFSPDDSVGGRAGFVSALGEHTYITLGAAFESYINCNSTLYSRCSFVYPEVGLAFSY